MKLALGRQRSQAILLQKCSNVISIIVISFFHNITLSNTIHNFRYDENVHEFQQKLQHSSVTCLPLNINVGQICLKSAFQKSFIQLYLILY